MTTQKMNPTNRDDPAYEGNDLFVRKEYTKALEAYSRSIEKHPDMTKLYSNRGLTYLRLGRPFDALKDLDVGLKMDADDEKLIYRKCMALLALRRFPDAGQFLDESIGRLKHLTKNKEFKALINDMDRLKPEYERGQYDLIKMIDEAKESKLLDNHADYFAWNKIEIRKIDINGKGRGLFAKDTIVAGELLIACKALIFAENKSEGDQSMDLVRRLAELSLAPMVEKMRKKLMDRPDLAEAFYRLYAGTKLNHLEKWTEGESNLLDMDRIESIVRLNRFGTGGGIKGSSASSSTTGACDDLGLWLIPSYINHTCVDTNCIRYFVGDYIFIRATKSIEFGEEILFHYVIPSKSFEKRQSLCRNTFGFECQCRLCVMDRQDSDEIKQRMNEIQKFMDDIGVRVGQIGYIPCDIPTMKELLHELLQLRPQRDLNYLALRVQEALGCLMSGVDEDESIRLITEMFEIYESIGDFPLALQTAQAMHHALHERTEDEHKKWKVEARRIAKLIYGDERLAGF